MDTSSAQTTPTGFPEENYQLLYMYVCIIQIFVYAYMCIVHVCT